MNYDYQLDVKKKNGITYTIYIFSSAEGKYVYSVYVGDSPIYQNVTTYGTVDDAFQGGFEWVKAQK